ncbi:hypothetical protein [Paenibacillus sp. FSL K6-1230]|uniref:hypothetical protein n=1 Tax=Paenibacillus sp. FSL K6-1230 TaxID=2921603 RepID=UPI0030FBD2DE
MKIFSWAVVFVIIVFPLFFKNDLRVMEQERTQEAMVMYNGAFQAAVQDAAFALQMNESQNQESNYGSLKKVRANKELAVEAFYETLFHNTGIADDATAQGVLKAYIPLLAIIDYDGIWVYTNESFRNERGELENRQVWNSKKAYTYLDEQGNSIAFTLDDYIYAYNSHNKQWVEGTREEVAAEVDYNIPLVNDPVAFEAVRRQTIIDTLQRNVEHTINLYNQHVSRVGISYRFMLPVISQEEWNNTINDVGVLSFIQGVPVGMNYYNSYALGGSRLIKSPVIYGYEQDGQKVYYRESDYFGGEILEKFSSERDAAQAGYYPGRR